MKLLAFPTSPYACRVLIQVYEKRLDLAVAYPAETDTLAEHARPNPFRRIPVLITEHGTLIESAAIGEYLEDVQPEPPLRPRDAFAAARMRGFSLAVDHYLYAIILALRLPNPSAGQLAEATARMDHVLSGLQSLMGEHGYACGDSLTLADCALAPALFYLDRFLARHGQESAVSRRPRLRAWRDTVNAHLSVARAIGDLRDAADRMGR